MNMLILGLGGTGDGVASRLSKVSGLTREYEIRVFDQSREHLGVLEPAQSGPGQTIYTLSARDARQILRNAASWRHCLDWLPLGRNLSEIDELAPEGSGGQRWLGRLSFFASDSGVQGTLRASLARLRESSSSELQRVVIVTSVGGGAGSGLFADVTYLIEHLARHASRVAFLLLPGVGTIEPIRSHANAYATLKETFLLKYQSIAFYARYPNIGERSVSAGSCEPWQRLYLFAPAEGEAPPYEKTLDRIAHAVAAHLHRDLRGRIVSLSQREVDLAERGEPGESRRDFCFSACELLSEIAESRESESRQSADAAPKTQADEKEESALGEVEEMKALRLFDIHVASAAEDAVRGVLDAIERRVETLEESGRDVWRAELTEVFKDLQQLERSVRLVSSSSALPDESLTKASFWERIRGWFSRRGREAPDAPTSLESLPGVEEAREEMRRGAQRLLTALPHQHRASNLGKLATRFLDDLKDRSEKGASADGKEAYEKIIDEQRKLVEDFQFRRVAVDNRCAALRAITEHSEFRRRLKLQLIQDLIDGTDSPFTEKTTGSRGRDGVPPAISEAPPSAQAIAEGNQPPDGGALEPQQAHPNRPEVAVGDPSWKKRIETVFHSAQKNVFSAAFCSRPRRHFSIALIPKALLEEAGQREIQDYLLELDPYCELVPTSEDRISIYCEDLFHSPCEIRHIDEWREAYLREPHRERLHIDTRFLAPSRFDELCARKEPLSLLPCGNPGCDADIADLPPEVQTCPKCGQPVRSRCGNEGCSARDLHLRPDGTARSCPECGGFNHAAWWLCCEHGKVPVWVPTDKRLCPQCIDRHQGQPDQFPEASIGRRPQGQGGKSCPNCQRLAETDPEHEVFQVPEELIPFYERGVNGHDRRKVALLAEQHGLPNGYQCPNCRTNLIPTFGKGCPNPEGFNSAAPYPNRPVM
jgi:Tubulin like